MMSEEEIEKMAEKMLEIQEKIKTREKRNNNSLRDITNKYHAKIYDKFGSTQTIESAIRTVAVYKCGQRYITRAKEEKMEECMEYAEKLYKDILGE